MAEADVGQTELDTAFSLTQEQETDLIRTILAGGWDQGCFLTADQAGELIEPATERTKWIERMAERERGQRPNLADPYPHGRDRADPPADQGYVVLTQRCDLLGDLKREPLIELAPCRKVTGHELNEAARNSPRVILAYRPPAGKASTAGWVVDVRTHVWVPKTRLSGWGEPAHIIERDQRPRFALRAGRRYSRKPVPEMYVDTVQRPLRKLVMGEFLSDTADFTEWLIVERDEDLPVILAAITQGSDRVRCEDVLHTILRKLESTAEEVIDIDASRVDALNDIPARHLLRRLPPRPRGGDLLRRDKTRES